eukprot:Phypoly_transcript_12903.p1 GENE.Phypoly_transcript_12903~~Phypoly_transcript_12903.p1  ORF type:complete len:334 (+),score=63.77 Phypoly_transcript_12903:82-1083(+)
MSIKAVVLKEFGGPENLHIGTVPKPQVTPDTVLVRVRAAGVNRADLGQRLGRYPPPPGESDILGLEISGDIAEVGENAKKSWNVGDKVMALLAGGGYAEYALVHAGQLMKIPANLSYIEAAGIPEAYIAAYQALEYVAHISTLKNPSILIHASASGVGVSAIQICKQLGVKTIIGTAGSQEKVDFVKKIGATHGINYKTESFKEKVAEITNKKGVSVVMDFVGASYWNDNLASLSFDGIMTMQGGLGGTKVSEADVGAILMKRLSILGTTLRARDLEYKAKIVHDFYTLGRPLFENGTWKPIISKVFKLEEVVQAHKFVEANENIGKVILSVE